MKLFIFIAFALTGIIQDYYLFSNLGLIHTGHFDAQYCDIAIKRYCDKKIFLSHAHCITISK